MRMYSSQASEDHLPNARMTLDGVPSSTRQVAPPARIDAPPKDFEKKRRNRDIKKDWVGTEPVEVNHKEEAAGKR